MEPGFTPSYSQSEMASDASSAYVGPADERKGTMPKLKPTHISPAPGTVDLTQEQIDEVAAGDLTFDEVEAKYGEDIAIRVGAARDPDNPELTAEDFATMRPAIEVAPELVEAHRRGEIKMPGELASRQGT